MKKYFKDVKNGYIAIGFIAIFVIIEVLFGSALGMTNEVNIWTFFLSAFSHGGYVHLAMNSIFLLFLSAMFYNVRTFLSVYFVSLVLSGLFSMAYIFLVNDNINVVGASGAIFGLFSYIFFRDGRETDFYINFAFAGILPIAFGMAIAWYAHIGGAIAGYLFLKYGKRERIMWKL